MKRLTIAVWLSALALAGCTPREAPPSGEQQGPSAATAAADFSIPSLADSGGNIALADYRGKVVLLDFWATWCPPCRSELPALNAMYDSLKDRGFALIGMTVDQGDQARVAEAAKPFGLVYPVGLAGPDVQAAYGGIRAVPTKFLLDKTGKIQKTYLGVVPEDQLRTDIQSLLTL